MSCEAVQHDLALYCYGELTPQDEERIEHHVNACPACRTELESLKSLFAALDRREIPVAADLLSECRQDLVRGVYREQQAPPVKPSPWRLFREAFAALAFPAGRWRQPVGAMALVALGFFSARLLQTTPGGAIPVSSPDTMISNVRSVQQDPTGRVRVAFDELRRRTVTGNLEDQNIQRLLMAAMRQEANPGVRVETLSVLKGGVVPSEIRDVLVHTLQNDPNPGVRLKAVESLRSFAAEPSVRQGLARALIQDDNPGVRIQAIDLLVQHKDGSMVGVLQELVGREDNEYIRMRMANALEDMNASVGTF
jgi:hypothetical protein